METTTGIYDTVPKFDIVRTGPYGPSDSAIDSYIDRYLDPQRIYTHLHYLWKREILRGRDNFHGLLARHNRSPLFPIHEYPSLMPDPPSRTVVRGGRAYDSYIPGDQVRHGGSVHGFEGIFLSPTGRSGSSSDFHLLSMEMAEGHVIPWDPSRLDVQGELRWVPGQTEWTRYILCRMGKKLDDVEIFGGVALSLFRYTWDPVILRAMATNWNYVHNTFLLEDREATVDLRQMSRLLGVPVEGLFYEERTPPEMELYGIDRRGTHYHPDSLRTIFRIYYEIAMARSLRGLGRDVPFEDWVSYFMDKVPKGKASHFADPLEPLGKGSDKTYDPRNCVPLAELSSYSFDDETFLTAYLAWWLCYFTVIYDPVGYIRPGVFVVANALARGYRVSLATTALVNTYRSMRELTSSRDPSRAPIAIPLHILHGWFSVYWSDCYSSSTSTGLRGALPALSLIAGSTVHAPDQITAHRYFVQSHHVISDYRPEAFIGSGFTDTGELYSFEDTRRVLGETHLRLHSRRHKRTRDYAISIREGRLIMRMEDRVISEIYSPQRCAWQFGYDQDIPSITIPTTPPEVTLRFLCRLGCIFFTPWYWD